MINLVTLFSACVTSVNADRLLKKPNIFYIILWIHKTYVLVGKLFEQMVSNIENAV